MKKINVAFIIDHLDTGGTESQLYYLIKALDKKRFTPHVYCLKEKGKIAVEIENLGIPVKLINPSLSLIPKIFNRLGMMIRLAVELRRCRIKIVQTYLLTANIFGTLAAKLAGVPVICASERGVINTDVQDLPGRNKVFSFVSRWIDAVFGNSMMVVKYLEDSVGIAKEKLNCIYNGIPTQRFQMKGEREIRTKYAIPDRIKLIGIIARLVAVKNHKMLLEALSLMKNRRADFRLIIVGDGPERGNLETIVEDLSLGTEVIFLGNQSGVEALLSEFDIITLSSDHEGLPNAIMEAMAASKPVVSTNAGGVHELVIHQETGFLVPKGDAARLAAKLEILLEDPLKREQMGAKAFEVVKERFSLQQMVENTQKLYLGLLAEKVSRSKSVEVSTPLLSLGDDPGRMK